jgi:hypothetical protein
MFRLVLPSAHIMTALDECGSSQWRRQGFRGPCVAGGSVFRESHKRTAYYMFCRFFRMDFIHLTECSILDPCYEILYFAHKL